MKTIYNYISKYKDKIHTKKENGKTVVSIADFAHVYQYGDSKYKVASNKNQQKSVDHKPIIENDSILNLQKEYKIALQKTENLQKYNNNLTDQVNKYAIFLKEEKADKKAWQEKYDHLNQTHFETIESF